MVIYHAKRADGGRRTRKRAHYHHPAARIPWRNLLCYGRSPWIPGRSGPDFTEEGVSSKQVQINPSQSEAVEFCQGNSYGSDCNLKCGEIAELIYPENSVCQADNTSNSNPICKLITCAVPDDLYDEMHQIGCVRGEDMLTGQSCSVKCPEGKRPLFPI